MTRPGVLAGQRTAWVTARVTQPMASVPVTRAGRAWPATSPTVTVMGLTRHVNREREMRSHAAMIVNHRTSETSASTGWCQYVCIDVV